MSLRLLKICVFFVFCYNRATFFLITGSVLTRFFITSDLDPYVNKLSVCLIWVVYALLFTILFLSIHYLTYFFFFVRLLSGYDMQGHSHKKVFSFCGWTYVNQLKLYFWLDGCMKKEKLWMRIESLFTFDDGTSAQA